MLPRVPACSSAVPIWRGPSEIGDCVLCSVCLSEIETVLCLPTTACNAPSRLFAEAAVTLLPLLATNRYCNCGPAVPWGPCGVPTNVSPRLTATHENGSGNWREAQMGLAWVRVSMIPPWFSTQEPLVFKHQMVWTALAQRTHKSHSGTDKKASLGIWGLGLQGTRTLEREPLVSC